MITRLDSRKPGKVIAQMHREMVVELFVRGIPAPQGSKRGINHKSTGRVVLIESSNVRVKSWREDVRNATMDAYGFDAPMGGPIGVNLAFVLPRPKYLCTKKAIQLPTPAHTKRPDIDKLVRATLDALKSGGVYTDDACVVELTASKRTADMDEHSGCHIQVRWAG